MSRTAFTTLLNRRDSALSPHFGKAKWVGIVDEKGQIEFEQNTGLNGKAVVEIMVKHGCKDAVFSDIGPGAFNHLEQAGIRGWIGPEGVPLPELAERLRGGKLPRAQAEACGHEGSHDGGHQAHHGSGSSCCGHSHEQKPASPASTKK